MPSTALPSGRPTQVRWLIFALACATSWLLYLHRYAWGVIKPSLKEDYPELEDDRLMGLLDSLFNVTYAIGQVPSGLAGDLLGPRGVLSVIIVAWSLSVAWLAGGQGFWQFAGIRGLFGLTQAGAYPNLSKVTANWFPARVRTTVQGIVASLCGRAGGACAPLLVATLLMGTLLLSWRQALLVLALIGLLFALVFWLLFRNSPGEHPWCNEAECELIEAGSAPRLPGTRPRLRLTGRNAWTLGALLVYSFASTFADQLFVFWIPEFLVEGRGLTKVEMGFFASLPLWGGALGGAVGGVLNDVLIRVTGNRRLGRSAIAFTGKMLIGLLLVISVGCADGRVAMVVLMAGKFFGDWGITTQWGATTDIAGRSPATVFGMVNTVGAVAGIVASPMIGLLKQTWGWETVFTAIAFANVFAALCWLVIDSTCRLVVEEPIPGERE